MTNGSVVEAVRAAGYEAFASALDASGYAEILDGAPHTLFAPNQAAFAKASHASLEELLHGDLARLRRVMSYHFVAGRMSATRLKGKRYRVVTHGGAALISDGLAELIINRAKVVQPDIIVGASIAHGIDAVLWPKEKVEAKS